MDSSKLSKLFKEADYKSVSFERDSESVQSLIKMIKDALGDKQEQYSYDLKIKDNIVNIDLKDKI